MAPQIPARHRFESVGVGRGRKDGLAGLRHAKSRVTKDRYIKMFDPALVAAMKKLEASVDLVNQSAPNSVGQMW
jgi:hypothetical protein